MKRIVIISLVVIAAVITAVGAVSAPAAKASGSIGICVSNCGSTQASGSTTICTFAGTCPQWFYWSGYLMYGPLSSYIRDVYGNQYRVLSYQAYDGARRWVDYYDCYYLMSNIFRGCYWR